MFVLSVCSLYKVNPSSSSAEPGRVGSGRGHLGIPDISLFSDTSRLLLRDLEAFPGQMRGEIPPVTSGSARVSSQVAEP